MPCVDGRHRLLEDLESKEFKWTRDANTGAQATEPDTYQRLHEPA